MTNSLVEFVHTRRKSKESNFKRDLPDGYCHIGIHPPLEDATGRWHAMRAFGATVAPEPLLTSRIAEKNDRVPDYRLTASALWLLIVNDKFLGPGEVYALPEDLAQWKFDFDFEKVLLFSREPSGGGKVFELQRA